MLSEIIPDRPCTQKGKLVKKTIPHIRDQISKNPYNGETISIWHDRIMRENPIRQQQNLRRLQNWMEEKNLNTLYSISEWDQNTWIRWRVLALPPRLKSQWEALKIRLVGVVPINKDDQDEFVWDPNGGNYTLKLGYNYLQNHNSD